MFKTPHDHQKSNFDFMERYNESVKQAEVDLIYFVAKDMKQKQNSSPKIAKITGLSLDQVEKIAV